MPIGAAQTYNLYCMESMESLTKSLNQLITVFPHSYSSEGHTPKNLRGKAPPVADLFNDTSPTQNGSPLRRDNQNVKIVLHRFYHDHKMNHMH